LTKPTILLFANTEATFVKRDISLLGRDYIVKVFISRQPKGIFAFLLENIKITVFTLYNLRSARFLYCWFADYHSFWPAFFAKVSGKPFYLVEGGYDTVYIPSLDYGVFTNWYRSFCVRYAVKSAKLNLPVSEFLKTELHQLFGTQINVAALPTGYDSSIFFAGVKKNTVLTIGAVNTEKRFVIKGMDRVLDVARKLPAINFIIIGIDDNLTSKINIPDNVELIGTLNENELINYLAEAQVYIQFSVREGLPNVVFEAMLCECVTIGINHSGLGEAIGDFGYLMDEWDVIQARELIVKGLKDEITGKKSREYVMANYSEEQRYVRMKNLIDPENNSIRNT